MTELGLKPETNDSQSFVPSTVSYSKGIRKPLHYPESPMKEGRKGRTRNAICLLNWDCYRTCDSGVPRQVWGTMISHVSLGQVPVRSHLLNLSLICSYTQHEIIEHLLHA